MRKKNGFTLVEIISVIGVLLLIAAIAIPSVIGIRNNIEKKNSNKIEALVLNSAEMLVETNRSTTSFPCYIKVSTLLYTGFLKEGFNEFNNVSITEDTCIEIVKNSDNTLGYSIVSEEKCTSTQPDEGETPTPDPEEPTIPDPSDYEIDFDIYCTDIVINDVKFNDISTESCDCWNDGDCSEDYCYQYVESYNDCSYMALDIYYYDTSSFIEVGSGGFLEGVTIDGNALDVCYYEKYRPNTKEENGIKYYSFDAAGADKGGFLIGDNSEWQLVRKNGSNFKFLYNEYFHVSDFNSYEQYILNRYVVEDYQEGIENVLKTNSTLIDSCANSSTAECKYSFLSSDDYYTSKSLSDSDISWSNKWTLNTNFSYGESDYTLCGPDTYPCESQGYYYADTNGYIGSSEYFYLVEYVKPTIDLALSSSDKYTGDGSVACPYKLVK